MKQPGQIVTFPFPQTNPEIRLFLSTRLTYFESQNRSRHDEKNPIDHRGA